MISPTLVTCEFHNTTGEVTKGYRLYDEYGQTYCNTWQTIPEDDLEILELAIKDADDNAKTFFNFMKETESGITINGEWYDFEQVEDLL
jgi:hypothetical protein